MTTSDQLVVICYLILSLLGHSTASDLLLVVPVTQYSLVSLLFIYLWLCWVFIAAGLSPVAASGASSLLVGPGPLIAVASLAAQSGSRCLGFLNCAS